MNFKAWMKDQYQWDDQFDMEPQYSQCDMETAFKAGAKQVSPVTGVDKQQIAVLIDLAKQATAKKCLELVYQHKQWSDLEIIADEIKTRFGLQI